MEGAEEASREGRGDVPQPRTAPTGTDVDGRGAGVGSADALFMQVDARCCTEGAGTEGSIPRCGMRYWIALRAAWLRVSEEDVAREPSSFEDAGSLQLAARNVEVRELSDGEQEDLEDVLDCVQRPFPRLRQSVPLAQAVQCAESLWDADD
mmetsp:Transcript_56058/g.87249  ORF Transcript_56058/g.87249 Transcript_56058/m.87249 type:complete len:151 (+) Transcript_56058:175-627(+)